MMKYIIPIIILVLSVSACNYKELGCIICYKKRKKDSVWFPSGKIKSTKISKSISQRGIDVPTKCKDDLKEYNQQGDLIKRTKTITIFNVWEFDQRKIRKKEKLYYNSDTLKKEINIYKNEKLIKRRIIK